MKSKILIGALLAATAGAVCAQSNVTLYGVVDAGLVRESGGVAGSLTKISSGIGSVSRLGFRGSEDLGAGLSANFVLELGTKIDTGDIDSAGTIFNRQAYVGLKSASAGALTLGRQYTPFYLTVSMADPFGTGYAGNIKNLFPTAGSNTRTSNTVLYVSPSISGLTAEASYSLGEQTGSNVAGRQLGAALAFVQGPLTVRAAYNSHNNDITAAAGIAASKDNGTNGVLAATYDLGVAKLFAAYGRDHGPGSAPLPNTGTPYGGVKATASTDSGEWLVGATIPAAGGTIMLSYISKNDKTILNQDASQVGIGYTFGLSKRTSLYTAYAHIHNQHGAGYTVGNNGEAGSGNAAFNAGVRHSF